MVNEQPRMERFKGEALGLARGCLSYRCATARASNRVEVNRMNVGAVLSITQINSNRIAYARLIP